MNVKINDNVLVICGKYAGKTGRVIATSPKNGTVTVEGVNVHIRHKKARKANEVSERKESEAPIDVSNVMVICDACSKAVRVKHAEVDGKKVRVCPKCGAVLDKAGKKVAKAAAKKTEEAPKKRVRKRAAKAAEAPEEAPAEDSAE